ncbi:glycoside hydrolase family 3 C-terminal domain-containing protein [Flavobacteriales bacterium]|jgi:beta-glucosidase|nr:glycoside hydrolase family 3 C-terminal domain-containing protein [Flavobacteriales bacterium]
MIRYSFIVGLLIAFSSCSINGNHDTGVEENAQIESKVDSILALMTIEEKIGQMTQIDQNFLVDISDISTYGIGSLLSGGGSTPDTNEVSAWLNMYNEYQAEALNSRLGIPLIYGIDAVHGHNNVYGATIFPHNVNLGCANDYELTRRVAEATAIEVAATGINWDFSPCIAIPQDERWGRHYEGFSEDGSIVSNLGVASIEGYQTKKLGSSNISVLACAKHFIADGATEWGTGMDNQADKIDRGNALLSDSVIRAKYLPPYIDAIEAGVGTVMASFNSINGLKCHANGYLFNDLLKEELGFDGFVISDWRGIDEIPGDFKSDIIISINAGIDMVMVPGDTIWGGEHYMTFLKLFKESFDEGLIPIERIDDAVRRILRIKYRTGLMDNPMADNSLLDKVGSEEHRAIAREAVQKSQVLLKNDNMLPLDKDKNYLVCGSGADDIGKQCGGWTIEWQGGLGDITEGTTIWEGISEQAKATLSADGTTEESFDAAIVVIGEDPYTEMEGDSETLYLSDVDKQTIANVQALNIPYTIVLITGRPLIVTEEIEAANAFMVAWLPGTEGDGVSDVLFGDVSPSGKLSFSWPKDMDNVPVNFDDDDYNPLYKIGYGLSY